MLTFKIYHMHHAVHPVQRRTFITISLYVGHRALRLDSKTKTNSAVNSNYREMVVAVIFTDSIMDIYHVTKCSLKFNGTLHDFHIQILK